MHGHECPFMRSSRMLICTAWRFCRQGGTEYDFATRARIGAASGSPPVRLCGNRQGAHGPNERNQGESDASDEPEGKYRTGPLRAQDIDRYVGARVRERRIMLGLTQQQMAELIGVTYQQAHKYEKGINRDRSEPPVHDRTGAGRRYRLLLRGLRQRVVVQADAPQRMLLELAHNVIGHAQPQASRGDLRLGPRRWPIPSWRRAVTRRRTSPARFC